MDGRKIHLKFTDHGRLPRYFPVTGQNIQILIQGSGVDLSSTESGKILRGRI
jgi:hypothetical protein